MKHVYEGGLTGFQDDLWIDDRRLIDLLDRDLSPQRSVYGQVRLTVEWLGEAGEREADEDIAAGRVESFKSLDELTDWLEADNE